MQDKAIDNINHPKHYEGKIECIDAMQEVLDKKGTISFCIGNALKYIWRCRKKHETPIEDLKKCQWYVNKAIELLESEGEQMSKTHSSLLGCLEEVKARYCDMVKKLENLIKHEGEERLKNTMITRSNAYKDIIRDIDDLIKRG